MTYFEMLVFQCDEILPLLGHAFILVFSVSSRKSLEELKPLLELIAEVADVSFYLSFLVCSNSRLAPKQVKGSLEGVPIMLAGNKSEEGGARREVPYRTGEALQVNRSQSHIDLQPRKTLQGMWNCKYIETSAKSGKNVHELFEQLLKMERRVNLTLRPVEEQRRKERRCTLL